MNCAVMLEMVYVWSPSIKRFMCPVKTDGLRSNTEFLLQTKINHFPAEHTVRWMKRLKYQYLNIKIVQFDRNKPKGSFLFFFFFFEKCYSWSHKLGFCMWNLLPLLKVHQVFYRGSVFLKWIHMLRNSIWYSHPLCIECFGSILHIRCRTSMWKMSSGLIHLKLILPL